MIILNAGAALYACDQAATFLEGVQLASDALHSGLAREKLSELIAFTEIFREEAAL
jgi:anthranilate phosphoribosyltransferase